MKDFFRKFPEYANNDFDITGESYAGVYVPLLTELVLSDPAFDQTFKVNVSPFSLFSTYMKTSFTLDSFLVTICVLNITRSIIRQNTSQMYIMKHTILDNKNNI